MKYWEAFLRCMLVKCLDLGLLIGLTFRAAKSWVTHIWKHLMLNDYSALQKPIITDLGEHSMLLKSADFVCHLFISGVLQGWDRLKWSYNWQLTSYYNGHSIAVLLLPLMHLDLSSNVQLLWLRVKSRTHQGVGIYDVSIVQSCYGLIYLLLQKWDECWRARVQDYSSDCYRGNSVIWVSSMCYSLAWVCCIDLVSCMYRAAVHCSPMVYIRVIWLLLCKDRCWLHWAVCLVTYRSPSAINVHWQEGILVKMAAADKTLDKVNSLVLIDEELINQVPVTWVFGCYKLIPGLAVFLWSRVCYFVAGPGLDFDQAHNFKRLHLLLKAQWMGGMWLPIMVELKAYPNYVGAGNIHRLKARKRVVDLLENYFSAEKAHCLAWAIYMMIRFAEKAHSGPKNWYDQVFWLVWMVVGLDSRYTARKKKTSMFVLQHSRPRIVNYSCVKLLNTRFLYIPRIGCMVSYFWSPEVCFGRRYGGMPLWMM
ncbi:hypothetical protein Hanom_Chr02g00095131 [Helianthus anomalus]